MVDIEADTVILKFLFFPFLFPFLFFPISGFQISKKWRANYFP